MVTAALDPGCAPAESLHRGLAGCGYNRAARVCSRVPGHCILPLTTQHPTAQAARRLIPLLDRVLIKRIEPPTKSIGGILLPESSQTKLNQGTVLSVGPGRRDADGKLIAMDLKANDTVMLPQYGGNEVEIEDEELVLFRADDILGILKD